MRTKNILCPVDFSDCSRDAFATAVDLANESTARLLLLHAYQFPVSDGSLYVRDMLTQVEADAEAAVAGWTAEAKRLGVASVEGMAVRGIPHDEIVRWARELKCDLIVMGTHGRSGIRHALIGSVAEKVVRHAPCTVMVVRTGTKPAA